MKKKVKRHTEHDFMFNTKTHTFGALHECFQDSLNPLTFVQKHNYTNPSHAQDVVLSLSVLGLFQSNNQSNSYHVCSFLWGEKFLFVVFVSIMRGRLRTKVSPPDWGLVSSTRKQQTNAHIASPPPHPPPLRNVSSPPPPPPRQSALVFVLPQMAL